MIRLPVLATWLWRLWLFWTVLELILIPFGLGASQVRQCLPEAAQNAALYLLGISDAVWIVLAAAFLYLHILQREGVNQARRIAGTIILGAGLLTWIGQATGWPFGPHIYTDRLGTRIAGIPFAIPLVWLVLITSARYAMLNFFEHATRLQLALGSAVLVFLTNPGLEFTGWKIRGWLIWWFPSSHPSDYLPWQNYPAWFIAAAILTWLAFPSARPVGPQTRPVVLLLLMNLVFAAAFVARKWGGF